MSMTSLHGMVPSLMTIWSACIPSWKSESVTPIERAASAHACAFAISTSRRIPSGTRCAPSAFVMVHISAIVLSSKSDCAFTNNGSRIASQMSFFIEFPPWPSSERLRVPILCVSSQLRHAPVIIIPLRRKECRLIPVMVFDPVSALLAPSYPRSRLVTPEC